MLNFKIFILMCPSIFHDWLENVGNYIHAVANMERAQKKKLLMDVSLSALDAFWCSFPGFNFEDVKSLLYLFLLIRLRT